MSRASSAILCFAASSLGVFGLAACGDDAKTCTNESMCGSGFRCERVTEDEQRVCVACDAMETRYDGLDNDCNSRTADSDLDRDGDNWKGAPVAPGGDCDDEDPFVSSTQREVCGDNKDNDCDDVVDELDCGDRLAPQIEILAPMRATFVADTVDFVLRATDDLGLATIRIYSRADSGDTERASRTVSGTNVDLTLPIDTTVVLDGRRTFIAEAVDLAGKIGRATIELQVDNMEPPSITIGAPAADVAYGGSMQISATASDGSNVASMEFLLDGQSLRIFNGAGTSTLSGQYSVNTASVSDGAHRLTVTAVDGKGFPASSEVNFFVDNTGPTISIVSPAPQTVVQNEIMVEVRATDNRRVSTLRLERQEIEPAAPTITHTFTLDTRDYPNGSALLIAEAEDGVIIDGMNSGHLARASLQLEINNIVEEPRIALTPADGSIVLGNVLITALTTSDVGTPIEHAEISVDGVRIANYDLGAQDISRYYDFSREPGAHVIEATAVDADNRVTTVRSQITVTQAPLFDFPREIRERGQFLSPEEVRDLDNDGIADLVTADYRYAHIYRGVIRDGRWYLGEGLRVSTRRGIYRIVDADGNGIQDVIVVYPTGIALLDRSTTPPAETISPETQLGDFQVFTLGDVDGDGDVDLVGTGSVDLAVHLNDDGNFMLASETGSTPGSWFAIRLIDLDDDGDLDAVLCGHSILTYLNTGGIFGSPFETPASADLGLDCEVGDVTGDGTLDVVSTTSGTHEVVTMIGDPLAPGRFTAVVNTASFSAQQVALIDLDGDDALDLATHEFFLSHVYLAVSAGDGTFEARAKLIPQAPISEIEAIDIDSDGDADLVTALSSSFIDGGKMYVAENDGTGRFAGTKNWSYLELAGGDYSYPQAMTTGHFTDPNLLGIAYLAQDRLVILGRSGDDFTPSYSAPFTSSNLSRLDAGNIDQQGLDDLVCVNDTLAYGRTETFINQGNGNYLEIEQPQSARNVKIADINADGLEDVIFIDSPSTGIETGVMNYDPNQQLLTAIDTLDLPERPLYFAVGDLGNDPGGVLDYAFVPANASEVVTRVWNGTSFDTTTYAAAPNILAIAIAKMDPDLIGDLVIATNAGVFVMSGMQGSGFSAPVQVLPLPTVSILLPGDFNGDGLTDLLGGDFDGNFIATANPRGGFFEPDYAIPGLRYSTIEVADFNNDGRTDFVSDGLTDLILTLNRTP